MGITRNTRSFPSTTTLNPRSPVSSHGPRRGTAQLKEQVPFRIPKGFRTAGLYENSFTCVAAVPPALPARGRPAARVGSGRVQEQNGSGDLPGSQGQTDHMAASEPYRG